MRRIVKYGRKNVLGLRLKQRKIVSILGMQGRWKEAEIGSVKEHIRVCDMLRFPTECG